MPILPIKSKEEFYKLFPCKLFDYVCVIFYSKNYEDFAMSLPNLRKDINGHCAYLDRLSNSNKYSHVMFVEINTDEVDLHKDLLMSPPVQYQIAVIFCADKEYQKAGICYDSIRIREILNVTLSNKSKRNKL